WSSPIIVGLFLAAAVLTTAFVLWERRVDEPILPLDLFEGRTFAAATVASFAVGAAMFGAIIYVPLFVQRVLGESASSSGVVLTPLMLGIITMSIVAGQIVSRTGHYRPVLMAGPPLLATGFLLLTQIGVGTSELTITRDVVVVGFGIGLMMQTLTVAVQNDVGRRRIGVATASIQFFRTIGAMAGVSVMGAIVTARIGGSVGGGVTPGELASALHPIFYLAIGLAAVALAAVCFVPHIELRKTMEDVPTSPELLREAA